ncbi:hypothetical protein B9Z55_011435 [Caenorhabditis nigoni]|uniref:BTB domain-containing protein n=1 Tax=Caenorhabditis nigoni TaxID=1611254 RepID=A0A2G5UK15_9PELO|nr:hypothetical protein B9Z55_011435 [Caenorhabditis nigoni]
MTIVSSKPILDPVKNEEELKDSKTTNAIEINMDTVSDATKSIDSLESKCLIIIVGSRKDQVLGMATHMKTIFDIPMVEIVNDYATVQKAIENLDTSKGLVLFSSNINLDTMDKIIKSKTLLKSSHKMVLGDVVPLYIPKNALNDFYNNVKSKKLDLHMIKTWRTEEEQNESAREFVIKVAKKYRPAFWRQWEKHGICREIAYQQAEIRSKWANINWDNVKGYWWVCAVCRPALKMTTSESVAIYDDFSQPKAWRPLEISAGNRSFFVDPAWLAELSPYFAEELFVRNPNTKRYVIEQATAEEVLEFLRCTAVWAIRKPLTAENVELVLKLADRFEMQSIQKLCEEFIETNMIQEPDPFRRFKSTITFKPLGIRIPHFALGALTLAAAHLIYQISFFYVSGWLNYDNLIGKANVNAPGPLALLVIYFMGLGYAVSLGWLFYETIIKHQWKEGAPEEKARRYRTTITIKGIVIPNVGLGALLMAFSWFALQLQFFYLKGWLNYSNLLGKANPMAPGPLLVVLIYSFILLFVVLFATIFNDAIIKHKWIKNRSD